MAHIYLRMYWTCERKRQEREDCEASSTRFCQYVLKNSSLPTLRFLCEAQLLPYLNVLTVFPTKVNGEIVQLSYNQLQDWICEINQKIQRDFKGASHQIFTLNDARNTISIGCKIIKLSRQQPAVAEQVVDNPLNEIQNKDSIISQTIAKLVGFLDTLIPQIQKFFSYLGLCSNSKLSLSKQNYGQAGLRKFNSQRKDDESQTGENQGTDRPNNADRARKAKSLEMDLTKLVTDILKKKDQDWAKVVDYDHGVITDKAFFGQSTSNLCDQLCQTSEKVMMGATGVGCSDSNVYKIVSLPQNKIQKVESDQFVGGVSIVDKVNVKGMAIEDENEDEEIFTGSLARKKLKVDDSALLDEKRYKNNLFRFTRERSIVEFINQHKSNGGYKSYLLKYYYDEKDQNVYYMDWVSMSLSQYLHYYREFLSISTLLDICAQIVFIVQDLHKCQVVHRDLKPSNFVVVMNKHRKPILKLIDFSDSMVVASENAKENPWMQELIQKNFKVYSTVTYSPIECSKKNTKHGQLGLDKYAIDCWSVGVLIYEVINGYVPVSYASSLQNEIQTLWPTQFLNQLDFKKKKGIYAIHSVFEVLKLSLVQPNQSKRISLQKTLFIVLSCKVYLKKLVALCFAQTKTSC